MTRQGILEKTWLKYSYFIEQGLFSASTFVFTRNLFSIIDIARIGSIGIYLVAFSTIITIFRPIVLKHYCYGVIELPKFAGKHPVYFVLGRMKREISFSLLIFILLSILLPITWQIKIWMLFLGASMIIFDVARFQNIIDAKPCRNYISNIVVLIGASISFPLISQLNINRILFLWITTQIIGLWAILKSRYRTQHVPNLQELNFDKFANTLFVESVFSQVIIIIFFTVLNWVNLEYSGMLRISILALTTIPAMYFSSGATPNSLSIASGGLSPGNHIKKILFLPIVFAIYSLVVLSIPELTWIMAGKKSEDFKPAILGAINIAMNIAIFSQIGFPFIEFLGRKKYLFLKIILPTLYYTFYIIILQNWNVRCLNYFLYIYSLIAIFLVMQSAVRTGYK